MVNAPLAITLMGPTAAGKTDLALALHDILPVDIISVDSALVYRGMDIGTAKPSASELARAPHRLIDIREPDQPYSVADFCRDARREMEEITANGRIPLLVGGTMLYFKALLDGLSDMPASDQEVRQAIEEEAAQQGWPEMHRQLAAVDAETAAALHPNHSQRIARALEVYRVSGRPISEWRRGAGTGLRASYRWVQLAIAPPERSILHQRIAQRLETMFDTGFLDEVRQLRARGNLHADLPSIRAVGYRQAWDYLEAQERHKVAGTPDDTLYQEMRQTALAATRQLAKRQLTWLRSWPDLNWLLTHDAQGDAKRFDEILKQALNCIGTTTI